MCVERKEEGREKERETRVYVCVEKKKERKKSR
jgi:hypothetical protein